MSATKRKHDAAMSRLTPDKARYLVGIDLGTTHTVVCYADCLQGAIAAVPQIFEIEQLVGPGEVAGRPMLPSFRYHPAEAEFAPHELRLPWSPVQLPGELERVIIGEFARQRGAMVAGRLVASAKSWLSHNGVDREAAILPWSAAEGVQKVSPVLASASYLAHVRAAWNYHHPEDLLEHQVVVITIPASFDEMARSLTVEAARQAGLLEPLLLEEPQAVCYDWSARHRQVPQQANQLLASVKHLLVCDLGGGTTDLSLLRVAFTEGQLRLTRIGVGDHLMLGGDNVDLALAHRAEGRLVGDGKKLAASALAQLIQQTRKAKESLLADPAPDKATVTVLGSGSRLIGGAKSTELTQAEVQQLVLEGFFPLTEFSELSAKRRAAVVEFGLPYAADPAVSRHLSEFLQRHQTVLGGMLGGTGSMPVYPDAILLNGGVFNSPQISQRVLRLMEYWSGKPLQQLDNPYPDLAVAFGAVAYAQARQGQQLKIAGGSARSYLLLVDRDEVEGGSEQKQGVCLLPKGAEEGERLRLSARRFLLRVGQPVLFHLYSSTADSHYQLGDLVVPDPEQFIELPPMAVVLAAGETDQQEVVVELETILTEIGTLQIQCVAVADEARRWNLEFRLRHRSRPPLESSGKQSVMALTKLKRSPRFDQALERIDEVFGTSKKKADPKAVKTLRQQLEKILGERSSWDTPLLRELFAVLLHEGGRRRRSNLHERLWLNLTGYCLRPGFGYLLDDWRVAQVWQEYSPGLQFNAEAQSWSEWWTLWRRIAGGLTVAAQQQIYQDVLKYLDPQTAKKQLIVAELKTRSYEDIVRLIATLEHLPVAQKIAVGGWLLERLKKASEPETSWWAIGRLGARVPFYGSAHNVIPPTVAEQWLSQIKQQDWQKNKTAALAATLIARKSGDRERDLDDAERPAIVAQLRQAKLPETWVQMVNEVAELGNEDQQKMFGESLPSGLKLIN